VPAGVKLRRVATSAPAGRLSPAPRACVARQHAAGRAPGTVRRSWSLISRHSSSRRRVSPVQRERQQLTSLIHITPSTAAAATAAAAAARDRVLTRVAGSDIG